MNYQLNSVEGLDTGSNYKFGDKMLRSTLPSSLFDLSHLNTLTIPNAGMLVPIALWETLPKDDIDINVDCLLRVMPQVVPLYSRQRLFIYGFYSRYSDLWCNWQVFKDKGYTGTDNRTIPILKFGSNLSYDTGTVGTYSVNANDLFDYMGLPLNMDLTKSMNYTTGNNAHISALPFMMYLRIYRDYFMNKNHWINDRVMLPDDDSRFRLNDSGILMSAADQNKAFYFCNTTMNNCYDISIHANGNYYFSGAMHDYPDDYFVSALPFPQRGNASVLNPPIDTSQLALDFTDSIARLTTENPNQVVGVIRDSAVNPGNKGGIFSGHLDASGSPYPYFSDISSNNEILTALNKGKLIGTNISLNITLNDIRKMAIEQQELEQLARTDGSYLQFGLSFFGEASKAAYDFKPTYIGGTYKNIAFTEVLQTATTQTTQSGSTIDNSTGSMYGHGITGISNGHIGHIHCDDYGMIMLIACIMPDVYYSQGLDRIFTDRTEAEKWMPERVLLGMQPIYNKEIYYAGNNGNSVGEDDYLWAYQNPFDHLRYIPNHIHGKIADTSNKSFYPYTQARHFTQLPNWGRAFSSTADVRKDYLVAKNEDAYTAQFSMNIRAVRPLPYKATPAKLVHF